MTAWCAHPAPQTYSRYRKSCRSCKLPRRSPICEVPQPLPSGHPTDLYETGLFEARFAAAATAAARDARDEARDTRDTACGAAAAYDLHPLVAEWAAAASGGDRLSFHTAGTVTRLPVCDAAH